MRRNYLLYVLFLYIVVKLMCQYVDAQNRLVELTKMAGGVANYGQTINSASPLGSTSQSEKASVRPALAEIIEVGGVVSGEVYVKNSKRYFSVGEWTVVSSAVDDMVVEYGDDVRVSGVVSVSQYGDIRNRGQLVKPTIVVLSHGNGNIIVSSAYKLKAFLTQRLRSLFSEPAASLAGGILIGTRSDIPAAVIADFKSDGLMHIVAVSGANMVIIITAVTQVLFMFYRRTASIIAIIFILFFTVLVGPSGAVVRATIMASLRLVAWLIGRPQYVKRLFFLTGLSMIAFDPLGAVFDIGFQLSVAATAGLIWLATPITKRLTCVPEFLGLRENLGTTIAATLATTPVTLLYFQTFSYLAILVNLIVVPLVPWLMLGSFVSLFLGIYGAYPTEILFDIMVWIVQKGAMFERMLH